MLTVQRHLWHLYLNLSNVTYCSMLKLKRKAWHNDKIYWNKCLIICHIIFTHERMCVTNVELSMQHYNALGKIFKKIGWLIKMKTSYFHFGFHLYVHSAHIYVNTYVHHQMTPFVAHCFCNSLAYSKWRNIIFVCTSHNWIQTPTDLKNGFCSQHSIIQCVHIQDRQCINGGAAPIPTLFTKQPHSHSHSLSHGLFLCRCLHMCACTYRINSLISGQTGNRNSTNNKHTE